MIRITLGAVVFASLLLTYWLNPAAAWIALFSASTLTVARYVRQRDNEADEVVNPVDW